MMMASKWKTYRLMQCDCKKEGPESFNQRGLSQRYVFQLPSTTKKYAYAYALKHEMCALAYRKVLAHLI